MHRLEDLRLKRTLAIKVPRAGQSGRIFANARDDSQHLSRFLEEAQITSQLEHPGVVPVHDLGMDSAGRVYFTMRLVSGSTASEIFAQARAGSGAWSITRGLEVILKVCDTIAYAHDKGVLHRDLKPDNVMVGGHGEVYVMDWGLAKIAAQEDRHDLRVRTDRHADAQSDLESSVVTMDGRAVGTVFYMSPEQANNEVLDERSDIYSIGAMLYELLSGQRPYGGKTWVSPKQVLDMVRAGPPPRLDEVAHGIPVELLAIVDKAMAREPANRYAQASELATDLRAFVDRRAVRAYRTGPIVELRLWMKRNRLLATTFAAAFVILLGGVVSTTAYAREARRHAASLEQRAIELQTVSDFQASQLAGIDVPQLAVRIRRSLVDAADPDVRAELETALTAVNLTGVAVRVLQESIFDRAVATIEREFGEQPAVRRRLLVAVARTMTRVGSVEGEGPELMAILSSAVATYRRAAEIDAVLGSREDRARTCTLIGEALVLQSRHTKPESAAELLDEAEASCLDALRVFTPTGHAHDWGVAQEVLAAVLQCRAAHLDGVERIEALDAATSALRRALDAADPSTSPDERARRYASLASLQYERGMWAGDDDALREALASCDAAIQLLDREAFAPLWVGVQTRLGDIRLQLGNRDPGETGDRGIADAVSAYRAALQVATRERLPQDWAALQNNLGNALRAQGRRSAGTTARTLLEAAAQACRSALEVHRRDMAPALWAMTTANLGSCLYDLAAQTPGNEGVGLLEEAATMFGSALEVHRREHLPGAWAATMGNLGNALTARGRRIADGPGLRLLAEGCDAYRQALEVTTRQTAPQAWESTSRNLALALRDVLERVSDRDAPALREELSRIESELQAYRGDR
ncbi:MAG: serine/threonine protein kinase [Planctomycetes bacterium]|nr:serine/threonine protein kinase [Planctomycetota bacterium]